MVLRRELKSKRRGVVGISTVTDPYQPAEKKYEMTRKCLLVLLKKNFPIDIQTKSDLVLRDTDLIKRFSRAAVGITITTLSEMDAKLLEPGAPPIEKRLDAVKEMADEGIYVYIFFGPVFPDITVDKIGKYVQTFIDSGAREIMIDSLHLKVGVQESIFSALTEEKKIAFEKGLNEDYYGRILLEMKKRCKGKIALTEAF